MGIAKDTFGKITDPLGIVGKDKAAEWADPLGVLYEEPDTSAADAEKRERERQARIDATISNINNIYDSEGRQKQISDYGADLLNFFTSDLNRQQTDAGRNLKFSLARSGQTGGSLAVDQNRTLGEEYQRGLLEANRRSQQGVADLRGRDEQSRLNLTQLAQQGLNSTAAAQQAAASMQTALEGSSASNRANSLGDLFAGTTSAWQQSKKAAEERRANKFFTENYRPFFSYGGQ